MSTHDRTHITVAQHTGPAAGGRRRAARRGGAHARALVADECGQALSELALVLPILAVVVFVIAQFALAYNSKNDGTNIANELARYAIINENPGKAEGVTAQRWAAKQSDSAFLTETAKVCVSFPEGAEAGKPVKVEVKSSVKWLPIVHLKVASTSLTAKAYMRLETTPSAYTEGCST
jgi:Flp pilus assembly protein TadG